jgi:hypothetical protein
VSAIVLRFYCCAITLVGRSYFIFWISGFFPNRVSIFIHLSFFLSEFQFVGPQYGTTQSKGMKVGSDVPAAICWQGMNRTLILTGYNKFGTKSMNVLQISTLTFVWASHTLVRDIFSGWESCPANVNIHSVFTNDSLTVESIVLRKTYLALRPRGLFLSANSTHLCRESNRWRTRISVFLQNKSNFWSIFMCFILED